ncbi:MAG: universal stress protein [Alicyclobacillus sp.]|nr:universal stress protein [Alicyclobacillus sp.]
MEKILLAMDGSRCASEAAKQAAAFLQAWPKATLSVVYVVPPAAYPLEAGVVVPIDLDMYDERGVADVKAVFAEQFGAEPRAKFTVGHGVPADVICQMARETHADLIIIGSHGKGFVKRTVLGSVSEAVLRHADVPVLVVREPRP